MYKRLLAAAAVLTGMILLLYPFIADLFYAARTEGVISALDEAAEEENDDEKIQEMLAGAEAYNQRLREAYMPVPDLKAPEEGLAGKEQEYESLLSFDQAGIIGYVSIPCIDVELPIYHGTSEEVLKKGAGHLYGTSLPIGGESTHTVITAHTGFGRARFFTDLIEVKKGDLFTITIPGRRLIYQADQIKVVAPEDTSDLVIEEGKDYCTLITCTPYGINSHRLLVRGVRVQEKAVFLEKAGEDHRHEWLASEWVSHYLFSLLTAAAVMTGAAAVITVIRRMRKA